MAIKVLIVDDSALVRKVLTDIISSAADIELAAVAFDPIFAIEKLKKSDIDVIILDVEMPRMDGLTFLEKLMKAQPTPVIMLSSLTKKNATISLNAMELGAFDVLAKPDNILELPEMGSQLLSAIRNAGNPSVRLKLKNQFSKAKTQIATEPRQLFTSSRSTTDKLIVIGSSTGGTTAIMDILSEMPLDIPGIVIVQHMPLKFTSSFAERLNDKVKIRVKIAENGEQIQKGVAYIAPGDQHCSIIASGAKYQIVIKDGPKVHYCRPSVAVLFNSAANYCARNTVGVMLTGMGQDGSMAMKKMKDAGSFNIVQDEESSVVWGMAGKAYEFGAADTVLPLDKIPGEICRYIKENSL